MAAELGSETIAKLKARAADPTRRTDMAAMGARSINPADIFAAQHANFESRSPEYQKKMREYLEGMNTPLSGMISNAVTGDASQAAGLFGALGKLLGGKALYANMGGQTIAFGGNPEATVALPPANEALITWAEAQLGFALPADLKAFYVEVANGEVGPGDGIYPLSGLIGKWREMTEEPADPQGQPWPAELLPIAGDDELFSIDRTNGRIVYWDVDEIGIEDDTPADDPGWAKSFKPVAETLDAWLESWLGR
jgi:hypothetical protein